MLGRRIAISAVLFIGSLSSAHPENCAFFVRQYGEEFDLEHEPFEFRFQSPLDRVMATELPETHPELREVNSPARFQFIWHPTSGRDDTTSVVVKFAQELAQPSQLFFSHNSALDRTPKTLELVGAVLRQLYIRSRSDQKFEFILSDPALVRKFNEEFYNLRSVEIRYGGEMNTYSSIPLEDSFFPGLGLEPAKEVLQNVTKKGLDEKLRTALMETNLGQALQSSAPWKISVYPQLDAAPENQWFRTSNFHYMIRLEH